MFSATISPSKGKGKDGVISTTWRPGWWDFLPLADTARRPVEWTASSTLVTAHPSHPRIIGRHISSPTQFHFRAPFLPKDAMNYEPPSVILAHPTEDYVFAYFPARHGLPGVGAIYQRRGTIDNWPPFPTLKFPPGIGIVGGRWLPNAREWAVDHSGTPYRLPPQGPRITIGDVSLLLVSEDCSVQLVVVRNWSPGLRITSRCYLTHHTYSITPTNPPRPPPEPILTRKCIDASIGLNYSDSFVYVAFRSRRSPTPPVRSTPYDASVADGELLGLPCDLNQPGAETEVSISQISIQQRENGDAVILSKPLGTVDAKNRITDMSFISYPPAKGNKQSALMFGVCTLEMDEYDLTAHVKSSYQLYTVNASITSTQHAPTTSSSPPIETGPRRTFDGVLSFVFPVTQGKTDRSMFIGLVDVLSSASKGHARKNEVVIGYTRVLNVADLSDSDEWESTPLWSSSQRNGGIRVPISAGISPNEKQVWTSSFTLWRSYTTLNPLPRRHRTEGQPSPEGQAIALAILARKSPSDIVHSLSQTGSASENVVNMLTAAFKTLQKGEQPPSPGIIGSLMGVALGIYRSLADHCKDEEERQRYSKKWQAAHDMMSMVACLTAFQEASKTETLWPLVKMASWFVEYLKKLLKACVVATNAPRDKPSSGEDDLFGSTPNSPVIEEQFDPVFISLVHPFALTTLSGVLDSIQKLKDLVDRSALPDSLLETGRHVLDDIVDNCPARIPELLEVISQANAEARKLDANVLIEVIASCQPTAAVRDYLNRIIARITQSRSLLDRSRLFIEPADLLDGVARLSLNIRPKEKDLDVVTKEVLGPIGAHWRCVRCGGRHHATAREVDVAWKTWEKRWIHHCVCKGYWEGRP